MIPNYNNIPDLGAAIIVKDGAGTIASAINSVKPFCRQIVVLDTGSVDNSPAICKRLGAELHFFRWTDDFSKARNECLRLMRTKWIISIDADEILDGHSFDKFISLFSDDSCGGIKTKIINPLDSEEEGAVSEHVYTRIFRKDTKIRYSGIVHEQIADSILEAGYKIADSEICIIHTGYMERNADKVERNRVLLEKEIAKSGSDVWLTFHLAETEFAANNFSKAKSLFADILNYDNVSADYSEKVRIRLAQIALKENNMSKVEFYTEFISEDIHREGFRKFVLAAAYLSDKKLQKALELYLSDEVRNSSLVKQSEADKAVSIINSIFRSEQKLF